MATAAPSAQPATEKKPLTYWRNISSVDQSIASPDTTTRIIRPGVAVCEDQFADPKALPRMKGMFIQVVDTGIIKKEKQQGKLVVGGPYNTSQGHYQPPTV